MKTYKFSKPEAGEELERYRIIEDRDDRVLAELVNGFENWEIKPTFVFRKTDLVECED